MGISNSASNYVPTDSVTCRNHPLLRMVAGRLLAITHVESVEAALMR